MNTLKQELINLQNHITISMGKYNNMSRLEKKTNWQAIGMLDHLQDLVDEWITDENGINMTLEQFESELQVYNDKHKPYY